MSRAQFSLEFILIFTIAFLIFLGLLTLLSFLVEDKYKQSEQVKLDLLAENVKRHLLLAHQSATSFEAQITLPNTLEGLDYTISVEMDNTLVVYNDENKIASYKNIPQIGGQFQKGCNRIIKQGDVIRVVMC
jgi:hypothetical protein